jgi:hypothetical protein
MHSMLHCFWILLATYFSEWITSRRCCLSCFAGIGPVCELNPTLRVRVPIWGPHDIHVRSKRSFGSVERKKGRRCVNFEFPWYEVVAPTCPHLYSHGFAYPRVRKPRSAMRGIHLSPSEAKPSHFGLRGEAEPLTSPIPDLHPRTSHCKYPPQVTRRDPLGSDKPKMVSLHGPVGPH